MSLAQRIEELIAPSLTDLGYAVVRITLFTGDQARLEVMIERSDEQGLSLDDCAKASRTISALLDVEDPIDCSYDLEVTSTGIDRPLTKLKDYSRFIGEYIYLQTVVPIEGQKRFEGVLKNCQSTDITFEYAPGKEHVVAFDMIAKAKLLRGRHFNKKVSPSNKKNNLGKGKIYG